MNTVKLYRPTKDRIALEMIEIKCTQSRADRKRGVVYAHEARAWGLKHGWTAKKQATLTALAPGRIVLFVRRAVLDRHPACVV